MVIFTFPLACSEPSNVSGSILRRNTHKYPDAHLLLSVFFVDLLLFKCFVFFKDIGGATHFPTDCCSLMRSITNSSPHSTSLWNTTHVWETVTMYLIMARKQDTFMMNGLQMFVFSYDADAAVLSWTGHFYDDVWEWTAASAGPCLFQLVVTNFLHLVFTNIGLDLANSWVHAMTGHFLGGHHPCLIPWIRKRFVVPNDPNVDDVMFLKGCNLL